jgi:hypothetical protein
MRPKHPHRITVAKNEAFALSTLWGGVWAYALGRRTHIVVELVGELLDEPCPFRVCTSALLEDVSFTRVRVLPTASTTGRKRVFLSGTLNFRKLAKLPKACRRVDGHIILAYGHRRASQPRALSYMLGACGA